MQRCRLGGLGRGERDDRLAPQSVRSDHDLRPQVGAAGGRVLGHVPVDALRIRPLHHPVVLVVLRRSGVGHDRPVPQSAGQAGNAFAAARQGEPCCQRDRNHENASHRQHAAADQANDQQRRSLAAGGIFHRGVIAHVGRRLKGSRRHGGGRGGRCSDGEARRLRIRCTGGRRTFQSVQIPTFLGIAEGIAGVTNVERIVQRVAGSVIWEGERIVADGNLRFDGDFYDKSLFTFATARSAANRLRSDLERSTTMRAVGSRHARFTRERRVGEEMTTGTPRALIQKSSAEVRNRTHGR